MLTRRHLLRAVPLLSAAHLLAAQRHTPPGANPEPVAPESSTSRPDVAAIDREHILAAADHALSLRLSADLASGAIPALTAATVLLRTTDPARAQTYAAAAVAHLRYMLIAPATRLNNELAETNHPEDLLPLTPLAEIAQSVPFLVAQASFAPAEAPPLLSPADQAALRTWFAGIHASMNTSRTGGLARDRKDHVGGVWLLVATACARVMADDNALTALRHHFRTVTIRAQILADGTLPHELTTPNPYRNSLFALDLLAASCDLLSTKFESLWNFELQDGPGLRTAVAKHIPWIEKRSTWPYPADQSHFTELPCRRPALLLAARAYGRPEYATIWRHLTPAEPASAELLATFPVRQPILWFTRPTR